MKLLARTRDNAAIVEMTEAEWRVIVELDKTVTERLPSQGFYDIDTRDIVPWLSAVLAWTDARYHIDQIDKFVSNIRKAIGEGDG